MRSISELKDQALATLSGKWASYVAMTLIYMAITSILSYLLQFTGPSTKDLATGMAIPTTAMLPFLGATLIVVLAVLPMQWSYQVMFLDSGRIGREPEAKQLFIGYKDYLRIVLTHILMYIFIILWSLLLVIPGIIKTLSYSMTGYVLRDNPELSGNAAIERSMQLMKGHKLDLFVLYLSFIGWAILALFTCGIGFLWLAPYMQMTMAKFYESTLEDERIANEAQNRLNNNRW
ncbi:MAG: DUF975 family protein [Muribaculaceae bacterium]|nr:DUF975 family protein [Muribaculaceae bacterium]